MVNLQDRYVLKNQLGQVHLVQPEALAALFEQFANQVDCVLLNACYSENQAKAIGKYIKHVIGMHQSIGDKAAIAFCSRVLSSIRSRAYS